jgi:protein MpaA
VLDWDGPAEELVAAMAAVSDLPARRLGSRPGSLGSWVGLDLCIPIVTVELPRAADELDGDELWERYGALLRAAIAFEAEASTDRS